MSWFRRIPPRYPPAPSVPVPSRFSPASELVMEKAKKTGVSVKKKAKKSNKAMNELSELEKENKRMTEENSLNKKDKDLIAEAIQKLSENRETYLRNTPDQLQRYSPKMAAMLETLSTRATASASALAAVIAIGTFCSFSERRCAVTTISCNPVCEPVSVAPP